MAEHNWKWRKFMRNSKWLAVIVTGVAVLVGACLPASAARVLAIEYAGDHLFLTAHPDEIDALDSGAIPGWQRTGVELWVHDAPEPGLVPVCRFYSTAFAPRSAHFYTADAAECVAVMSSPDWTYEGTAFFARLPDANGYCQTGSAPIYRWFNNGQGGVPNHRYTPYRTHTPLLAGWTREGVETGGGASLCMHWEFEHTFDIAKPRQVAMDSLRRGTWEFTVSRQNRPLAFRIDSFRIDFSAPPDPSRHPFVADFPAGSTSFQRGTAYGYAYWDQEMGDFTALFSSDDGWSMNEYETMTFYFVGRDALVGCLFEPWNWLTQEATPCHALEARRL
jgi:hypothetical protein